MKIPFVKYQGTGNDFIMIDETVTEYVSLTEEKIRLMCDRHFGIGADGLIRLRKAEGADFEMLYYNSDGRIGSMCGNGGRCAVAFAMELKQASSSTRFIASDGPHEATVVSELPVVVKLKMSDVGGVEKVGSDHFINTGSPHYVKVVTDPDHVNVVAEGSAIRHDKRFAPGGTNVNFVSVCGDNELRIRTFERGVEDETLSCGTGIVGSVLSLVHTGALSGISPVLVQAKGGKLSVYFERSGSGFVNVFLEGPVEAVFNGVY